jgi:hypothetical protein
MLGSPNLHRGNVPLAMRLKIDDLHAHLVPLNRYGLPGLSSAMRTAFVRLPAALRARCAALSVGARYRPPRNRGFEPALVDRRAQTGVDSRHFRPG